MSKPNAVPNMDAGTPALTPAQISAQIAELMRTAQALRAQLPEADDTTKREIESLRYQKYELLRRIQPTLKLIADVQEQYTIKLAETGAYVRTTTKGGKLSTSKIKFGKEEEKKFALRYAAEHGLSEVPAPLDTDDTDDTDSDE